jgi:hypothetical protein
VSPSTHLKTETDPVTKLTRAEGKNKIEGKICEKFRVLFLYPKGYHDEFKVLLQ